MEYCCTGTFGSLPLDRMKLLMISGDRAVASGKRGAFHQTLEVLSRHWERIDVICPCAGNPDARCQVPKNVTIHPSPRGLWYQPWWILKEGLELHAGHRHDVMTVHCYPPFYNSLGARWLAQRTGMPFVIEVHHVVGHPQAASAAEYVGRVLSRLCMPRIAQRSAGVRVVNATVRSLLISWGVSPEKIRTVPSFYLDRQLLTSIPEQRKVYDIAFCSRFVANKGLLQFLAVLRELPGARAVVIGDGPLRARAERRAQVLGIADRVTFTGWLPEPADVLSRMMQARVFVMNSRSEGGPRVLLEAMALGLPVIATPVGIAPEVIKDGYNGVLTTGEPDDLRNQLQRLLADASLRDRIGKEARSVMQLFERTRLVREYAQYLQSLA